jgi:hypothetical protein
MGDNAGLIKSTEAIVEMAEGVLESDLPRPPADVTDSKGLALTLRKLCEEIADTGQALVASKLALYYVEKRKREVEAELGNKRGAAHLASLMEVLGETSIQLNDVKFALLDRTKALNSLKDALSELRSAVTGGW